jgi:hypothetical protein
VSSGELRPEEIFACTRCGDCCKGYGGTTVGPEDIAAIAAFLGADPAGAAVRYCRPSSGKYLLAQREDGYCIFWNHDGCAIHPVKPRLCRRWPFIESVLRDPLNWIIMAGFCPGMRRDVSLDRIRDCVAKVLAAEGRVRTRSGRDDG